MASTGATHWAVAIASSAGTVRTASGSGGTIAWTWNGTDGSGHHVPDGRYTAAIGVADAAGNRAIRVFPLIVDTTRPAITRTASPATFSPNADGIADTTRLAWSANEPVTGQASIVRGSRTLRTWRIGGTTGGTISWDGRTGAGRAAADGHYALRIDVRDTGGNRTVATTSVTVDRTAGGLRWAGNLYPQDGDHLAQSAALAWTQTRTARATLAIYDASGALVRSVFANRSLRAGGHTWTWNGRNAAGAYVPQGAYQARLTVRSSLGTSVLTRTVTAAAFVVTPSASRVKPGQTLRVTIRAVEPLASKPVVVFTQPGRAARSVTATRSADGSYRVSFPVRSGPSGAATVVVSARDTGRGLDRTTVPIRVAS